MRCALRLLALCAGVALIGTVRAQLVTPPSVDWVSIPSTAAVGQSVDVGVGFHANYSDNSDGNDWNSGMAVVLRTMIDLDRPSGSSRIYDWLPAGAASGQVWTSFTVNEPGTHYITVQLMDGRPWFSDSYTYSISIPSPAPSITSQLNVSVNQGYNVSYTITAANGPTSFGASNLPGGLSLNTSTGVISGRVAPWTSTVNSTITATNAVGTDSKTLVWNITGCVITSSSSVSPGTVSLGGSFTLTRDGWANFGIAWTEATLWKPDGTDQALGNGQLGSQSYTPSAIGNYSVQVRIVDNSGYNYADQWLTFAVAFPTPTGLSATSVQSMSCTLSWNSVSNATYYHIYRNGTYIGSTTGTSFNVTGLAPGTNYSFTIQAQDSANNYSLQSSAISTTTAASFILFSPL
jgi:hypothetical protein